MNKEITKILKNRLETGGGLEFIDVYSGLVQTVSRRIEDENGNPKSQRFPVSYDNNLGTACGKSPEKALIPDSKKKGLIYFEETGAISVGRLTSSGFTQYRSNLTMVVWLNKKKITGETYSEITKTAVERLLSKLSTAISGEVGFINIKVKAETINQNPQIFGKYTYDEEVTQYLRPPFEYFAVGLSVSYFSKNVCAPELIINPIDC